MMEIQLITLFLAVTVLAIIMFKIFIVPILQRYRAVRKGMNYQKKYKTEAIGEVVGSKRGVRHDLFIYLVEKGNALRDSEYSVYSPIIKYRVGECDYEIDAEDYAVHMPVLGRRARVIYNPQNPTDACVWISRKYKKHLKIWKRDKEFIYCSCGLKRNIRIPVKLTEERAVCGRFVVQKYGFYHLEHPNDQKKSFMQLVVDGMSLT